VIINIVPCSSDRKGNTPWAMSIMILIENGRSADPQTVACDMYRWCPGMLTAPTHMLVCFVLFMPSRIIIDNPVVLLLCLQISLCYCWSCQCFGFKGDGAEHCQMIAILDKCLNSLTIVYQIYRRLHQSFPNYIYRTKHANSLHTNVLWNSSNKIEAVLVIWTELSPHEGYFKGILKMST
jgi:hypothetical protein